MSKVSPKEAQKIAEEAYIYAFPMAEVRRPKRAGLRLAWISARNLRRHMQMNPPASTSGEGGLP